MPDRSGVYILFLPLRVNPLTFEPKFFSPINENNDDILHSHYELRVLDAWPMLNK